MGEFTQKEQEIIIRLLSKRLRKNITYSEPNFMESPIGFFWTIIPKEIVKEVISQNSKLLEEIRREEECIQKEKYLKQQKDEIKKFFLKYCEAVKYYYLHPSFDDEGFYTINNSKKKYFTFAQLDELLDKFNKRKIV